MREYGWMKPPAPNQLPKHLAFVIYECEKYEVNLSWVVFVGV